MKKNPKTQFPLPPTTFPKKSHYPSSPTSQFSDTSTDSLYTVCHTPRNFSNLDVLKRLQQTQDPMNDLLKTPPSAQPGPSPAFLGAHPKHTSYTQLHNKLKITNFCTAMDRRGRRGGTSRRTTTDRKTIEKKQNQRRRQKEPVTTIRIFNLSSHILRNIVY